MDCSSHTAASRQHRWQGGGQHGRRGSLHLREVWRAGSLRLEVWPSRLYAVPVALFTLLWLRFLWRWYSLVLASADSSRGFLFLFGLPFILAGVSLVGTSVRLVLGRTLVVLDALRLFVGEQSLLGTPSLLLPTHRVVDFVAECSSGVPFDDGERELDSWHVQARLYDGCSVTVPLPVRTLVEADGLTQRLNRALDAVRQPSGYRDLA